MATWEIIRCMSSVLAPMQEELTKSACVEGSVCDTRLSMNVSRTLAVSLIGSGIVWKSMPHASVLVLFLLRLVWRQGKSSLMFESMTTGSQMIKFEPSMGFKELNGMMSEGNKSIILKQDLDRIIRYLSSP